MSICWYERDETREKSLLLLSLIESLRSTDTSLLFSSPTNPNEEKRTNENNPSVYIFLSVSFSLTKNETFIRREPSGKFRVPNARHLRVFERRRFLSLRARKQTNPLADRQGKCDYEERKMTENEQVGNMLREANNDTQSERENRRPSLFLSLSDSVR